MVCSHLFKCESSHKVLYSMKDRKWKVADFGLTCEATSTALIFTDFSRGTPGYRSPELLKETNRGFNTKLDIWSMGCILYELVTGSKLFLDDFSVNQFAALGESISYLPFKETIDKQTRLLVLGMIQDMLHISPSSRPMADDLVKRFEQYHGLSNLNSASVSPSQSTSLEDIPHCPATESCPPSPVGNSSQIEHSNPRTGHSLAEHGKVGK